MYCWGRGGVRTGHPQLISLPRIWAVELSHKLTHVVSLDDWCRMASTKTSQPHSAIETKPSRKFDRGVVDLLRRGRGQVWPCRAHCVAFRPLGSPWCFLSQKECTKRLMHLPIAAPLREVLKLLATCQVPRVFLLRKNAVADCTRANPWPPPGHLLEWMLGWLWKRPKQDGRKGPRMF